MTQRREADPLEVTIWRARRALPPAPTNEVRVLPPRLAILQRSPIERLDRAASRLQHRLRRAGVPFHGPPKTRIEIGPTLGYPAELQARPKIDHPSHRSPCKECIQLCSIPVMPAGDHR